MKFTSVIALAALAHVSSAHYIWTTLVAGSTSSTAAVRQPSSNSPVLDVTSSAITCNNGAPATATVPVAAGSTIGFKLDNSLFHQGPAAIYLGKAPSGTLVSRWNGSGANWVKIAEWGGKFTPAFNGFLPDGKTELSAKIPSSIPNGEYLARIEHIALHSTGAPQFYMSCAQISITGGGSATIKGVSIPGYIAKDDPSILLNIYYPVPTAYKVPGPAVFA